jgi:hypothetical protein
MALTATSAAMVLVAGVAIVAFASPGSHAAQVTPAQAAAAARPDQPAIALQTLSVTPAAGAKGVNGARTHPGAVLRAARRQFPDADAFAADRGQLEAQGDTAVFTPAVGYRRTLRSR